MSLAAAPLPFPPDLAPVKALLLNSVSSPITRALYAAALDDFFAWKAACGHPPFQRAAIQGYRAHLEARDYAASTVNLRLAALRKLAREAAACGLLDATTAAGIVQTPGVRERGSRAGNWLSLDQAAALLRAPDTATLRGLRDRAVLAMLTGCALRRGELVLLTVEDLQQREGRWVLPDLRGKHGRIRTVPVPSWVKQAADAWLQAAGLTTGRLFRSLPRHGGPPGESITPQAILDLVRFHAGPLGLDIRPHDLRRTCAKLCRAAGGEIEQIQLLLGHASIQTTERYLGTRQNLAQAPNDRIGLG